MNRVFVYFVVLLFLCLGVTSVYTPNAYAEADDCTDYLYRLCDSGTIYDACPFCGTLLLVSYTDAMIYIQYDNKCLPYINYWPCGSNHRVVFPKCPYCNF